MLLYVMINRYYTKVGTNTSFRGSATRLSLSARRRVLSPRIIFQLPSSLMDNADGSGQTIFVPRPNIVVEENGNRVSGGRLENTEKNSTR